MSGGLAIAVLAAGSARRFGGGKLDVDCAGKPLGRWALDAARTVEGARIAVIVGPAAPHFLGDAEIVRNPHADEGLGTSVAAAARWASASSARALLLSLADMPLVTTGTLAALVDGQLPSAVGYPGDRPGVPACFPAAMFGQLANLGGEEGAGPILAGHPDLRLVSAGKDELRDVDRPEDLADVAAILSRR